MIYGNRTTHRQLQSLIGTMLSDESQTTYPFILIAGHAHVGKSTMIRNIIADADLNAYDVVIMQDFSDDWLVLKEKNDLAGTSHSIQLDVESKRQDITLPDKTTVHNWGVRELQDWLVRSPLGSDKVVLIEAIERATGGASNALLKTLEEPLPHRLMIATTHHLSQLPDTIVSRAMVFHVDRLSDDEMLIYLQDNYPDIQTGDHQAILMLASGRPGIIAHYHELAQLDELLSSWTNLVSMIGSGPIAPLYQQLSTLNKSGYLSVMLDALLVLSQKDGDHILYDATMDLVDKQSSNVNIENLLFEWCLKIGKNQK